MDAAYNTEILKLGRITTTVTPQYNMAVAKVGRTTGLTEGMIFEIRDSLVDIDGTRRILFRDLIVVGKTGRHQHFGKAGDSGALLVALPQNAAVGLYFAGAQDGTYGLAQPIMRVLDYFNAELIL
jgi:hypothetical protein